MSTQRDYTVRIKRSAEKEMERLPARTSERVTQAILRLERNSRPPGPQKLRSGLSPLSRSHA